METLTTAINEMLAENERRNQQIHQTFNPLTGEGCLHRRTRVHISDYKPCDVWLPDTMLREDIVRGIIRCGAVSVYARQTRHTTGEMMERLEYLRCKHDFCYWAWRYVRIKPKDGGEDIPLTLNRAQRRLVEKFEEARLKEEPIRVIVLKARQWGGSTVTQIYMAWLQLLLHKGLNSLIVGHVKTASAEVSSMFDKLMERYPMRLLECAADSPDEDDSCPTPSDTGCCDIFSTPTTQHTSDSKRKTAANAKITGDRHSRLLRYIPLRNCKIKVGSAETPNSARGGDSALVHCTEVAFWRKTDNKTPEDIIRSACAGASYKPHTMIVYESTANGTGNFFQREYDAANRGVSQFKPLFVAWWQIEQYALPLQDATSFARRLYENRTRKDATHLREESGRYLWRLWEMGATLEAIKWYINERRKYNDHGQMAAEFPSDDIEAFQNSGSRVFDTYQVQALRKGCRPPRYKGELRGMAIKGKAALERLHFDTDDNGLLWIWDEPERFVDGAVSDRYLVVVDIGGRSHKADWSVVCVIDRYWMLQGDKPVVCAQWYGHTDIDLLAWKAVQIAHYYEDALLVIESNTLETHDDTRWIEGGDQSPYILNEIKEVYPCLYARRQSAEDIRERRPAKYGFHTNIKTKPEIISTLVEVVRERLYVERDERCLDEYDTYVRRQNGSYGAIEGKHDDLLMTRAIGLHICFHEMPMPKWIPLLHQKRKPHIQGSWWN